MLKKLTGIATAMALAMAIAVVAALIQTPSARAEVAPLTGADLQADRGTKVDLRFYRIVDVLAAKTTPQVNGQAPALLQDL